MKRRPILFCDEAVQISKQDDAFWAQKTVIVKLASGEATWNFIVWRPNNISICFCRWNWVCWMTSKTRQPHGGESIDGSTPNFFKVLLSWKWICSWTVYLFTVPKFAISQSEANSTVLISYDIKSLTWFCYRNAKFWAEFGYGKYLIVSFWYASAAYQARLVSPWVFWLDCVSPKYEPWLDQTRLICHRSVPKRYD